MTYKLYFTNGGEPSADERRVLTEAYNAWEGAREGGSNDDEIEAAYGLIEELMAFASIEVEDMDDDYRECDNCGDDVHTLSTRDWCDGCEEEAAQAWAEAHTLRDSLDRVVAHVMPVSQTIKLLTDPGDAGVSFGGSVTVRPGQMRLGSGEIAEGGQPYPSIKVEGGQQ